MLLGVLLAHLEVAELGVGHELAVDEQRAADAGAERHHDHDAGAALARAERDLGDAGGVGVVDHRDLAADRAR